MNGSSFNGWQAVQAEVVRRLHARIWNPGDLLPHEALLAAEFGCARSTVNRALQSLAEQGLLERRRRGGTRVLVHPEPKASFRIPIIRHEIEQSGADYGYQLLHRRQARVPTDVRERMQCDKETSMLNLRALHTLNTKPYVLENRWIDLAVVPEARQVDFSQISANEWLVEHVPFHSGELQLSALSANASQAKLLKCKPGTALFAARRLTRDKLGATITAVQLIHASGYCMAIEFSLGVFSGDA